MEGKRRLMSGSKGDGGRRTSYGVQYIDGGRGGLCTSGCAVLWCGGLSSLGRLGRWPAAVQRCGRPAIGGAGGGWRGGTWGARLGRQRSASAGKIGGAYHVASGRSLRIGVRGILTVRYGGISALEAASGLERLRSRDEGWFRSDNSDHNVYCKP